MKKAQSDNTLLLVGLALAVLLAANALLGFMLTGQSRSAMKVLIQNRMLDISKTAADMLDGDKLKALKAEDKGKPDYQQVNDTLAYFQNNIDLKYIYCVQYIGNKQFVFSVDPTIEDPGEFGSPVVYTDALYQASLGQSAVDEEPYTDEWGSFYSAYSPVLGSDDKVAGIVAVDFDAEWYDNELAKQTRTIAFCLAISTGLCILLVLVATRSLRSRLRDMTKNLSDLSHDLSELTWAVADIEAQGDEHQPPRKDETNLGNLHERVQEVRDGLRRYWEDSSSKANNIITALGSDYRNVYYLDLDTGEGTCHKAIGLDCSLTPGQKFTFLDTMEEYAKSFVVEADREAFLKFMHPEAIHQAMGEKRLITHLFMVHRDELKFYELVRIAAIKNPDSRSGLGVHAVGIGIREVDWETSQFLARNRHPEK